MEQIGEYRVVRLIGEGGMGKVYEGEERLSKRRVALKVLHPELARSDQGRRLFLNEMAILAHLDHPNIVRSLASVEADGELVMVLEFLDGRTLRRVILDEGRLPWGEVVRIVSSIAAALAAAHGQEPPIVHRDLKPENVMLLQGGAVKVMDFGIAKVLAALDQTNTQSAGTLQYMSPEQIDARSIDHRSDLYCLGLVFYELLAGRAPFQSASPRQLLNLQCTAEPPPLPEDVRAGLPRGVEQLVFDLLEKAPEDRPFLAEQVIERLEPFQPAGPPKKAGSTARGESASGGTTGRTPRGAVTDKARPAPISGMASMTSSEEPAARVAPTLPEPERGEAKRPERADTIALVERIERGREVPVAVAVAIIVALSAIAGLGAYLLRATGDAAESPAGSATGVVRASATASPTSASGGRRAPASVAEQARP